MMLTFSSVRVIAILVVVITILSPSWVSGLGSASTIAISFGSGTVCGVIAGKLSQKIDCFRHGQVYSIGPNVSYDAISGGRSFFCGLSFGGSSLFCWEMTISDKSFRARKIYHNVTAPLTNLAVGDDQVCALRAKTGIVRCWVRRSDPSSFLLPEGEMGFHTITSGAGFSCGIVKNGRYVMCWGASGMGDFIESEFANMSMLSLVAGKSHACGIAMSGILICKGNNGSGQLGVPSDAPFFYKGLALGANHTCAIQRNNGSAVCWGRMSNSIKDARIGTLSFEILVSGLDFTCGLISDGLEVTCWGPGWHAGKPNSVRNQLPLPLIIPGPCVRDGCIICGVYPDSESLCASHGTKICRTCVVPLRLNALPDTSRSLMPPGPTPSPSPSSMMLPSLSPPPPPPPSEEHRPYWVYELFGSVGIVSGICALAFCVYTRRSKSSNGKVQDVKEAKESNSVVSDNVETVFIASYTSSAPQSRSSSITQLSSITLRRERSWDLSKHVERSEVFSLSELAAATKNFSSEKRIGKGSFGVVYWGKLANGREVAIKKEDLSTRKMEKDNGFELEIALLSRVHHKHLVGLVGFCEENNERLLVYEYISNGSLYDHLHYKNNSDKGKSPLNSWKMRIKVALDAARGIEYLHNYAVPPIIHRDIKSSNILLDANWVGRVSDFGLSLKGPDHEDGFVSTKAVGTFGYIDPEYYVLKLLTTKSDVYGFGVVLLELLTGKKSVFKDEEENIPTGVVDYASPLILGSEVWKVLDKRVALPVMNESEAVELLAYTALQCVSLEGKDRPTMSDIVAKLERALALCNGSYGGFSPTEFSVYSFRSN